MNITSPLTKNQNILLLKTIQAKQLIHDWENNFQIDINNELKSHKKIYLYQCNQTKLKFFAPLDIAGSSRLYEQLQKFDWYYMPNKWEHQVALKDLLDCNDVLEIGSGFGAFVKSGIKAGLSIRGIELNEKAVKNAKKRNLPVEHSNLKEAADFYFESLDGVCSFQVLEHVPNPKEFIDWSIKMLKLGGKLIYCVPNSESFLKYQYNLLDLPPHHMTHWSKSSFEALEKIFPIRLEKVVFEPLAPYHVSEYLSSYRRRFKSTSLGKLLFNRYSTPIYAKFLDLGLRKFLPGQSLYVQFRKV